MHPLWQEAVSSLPFKQLGKVKRTRRRQHINVSELSSAIAAEQEMGKLHPSSHFVQLLDSQVALAALLKGRSSSASLNQVLTQSISQHVQQNVRPFYGYVESKRNPSDDPTRSVPIRAPCKAPAPWFADLLSGDVRKLDEFLEEAGLSPLAVSELPPESELACRAPVDLRKTIELRRQRRRKCKAGVRPEEDVAGSSAELDKGKASAQVSEREEEVDDRKRSQDRSGCKDAEKDRGLEDRGCRSNDKDRESKDRGCRLVEEDRESEDRGRRPAEAEREAEAEGKEDELGSSGYGESSVKELLRFDSTQFVWNKKFGSFEEALRSGPGFLDLYSGSRGVAKAIVRQGGNWVLCFDLKHSPSEDLSSVPLQEQLLGMISRGFFLAMGAGPVCSSFSTAITPPCRTKEHPRGTPWCSILQQEKNRIGNEQLAFVLRACMACGQAYAPVFFLGRKSGFVLDVATKW